MIFGVFNMKLVLFWILPGLSAAGFYDLGVMAGPGDLVGGGVLNSVGVECSVGSGGDVVFSGGVSEGGLVGEVAMVGRSGGVVERISDGGLDGRRFNFVQLSESGAAIGRERDGSDYAIQLYNWKEPVEVLTAVTTETGVFDFVTLPTVAGDGGFSFAGLFVGGTEVQLYVNGVAETVLNGGGHRPMAANGGKCLVRNGGVTDGWISVYGGGEMVVADAGTSGWAEVGRMPGISEDGEAVAFFGKKGGVGDEEEVFVALRGSDGASYGSAVALTSLTVASGVPVGFDSSEFDLGGDGRRVGCAVDGDVLTVVFVGTPAAGSVGMSYVVEGQSFTIGAGEGVWAMRVELTEDGMGEPTLGTAVDIFPVVQVGDLIDGSAVTSLFLSDPLAGCGGLAFYAGTAGGGRIVRAQRRLLDGDGDGLPDVLELALGSSPSDAGSRPNFEWDVFEVGAETALQLRFSRVIGSGAQVEQSADLMSWSALGVTEIVTGVGGAGELVTATAIGGERLFLRVRVGCSN